jgi:hypothetical protein
MLAGRTKPAKDAAKQAANLARKQNNTELLRDIEAFRRDLNNPLAGMLGGLLAGGLGADDDEEWFA